MRTLTRTSNPNALILTVGRGHIGYLFRTPAGIEVRSGHVGMPLGTFPTIPAACDAAERESRAWSRYLSRPLPRR